MRHQIRWTLRKITRRLAELEPLVYRQEINLPKFQFKELPGPPVNGLQGLNLGANAWSEIERHQYWACSRTNFALRNSFSVPAEWIDKGPAALHLDLGDMGDFSHPEALVYIDGKPYAACDRRHREIILPEVWIDGKPHELILLGWTGIGGSTVGSPHKRLKMGKSSVALIDSSTRAFIALARVAVGATSHFDEGQPSRHHLLTTLDEAFKQLDLREPIGESFYTSVPLALETLQTGIEKSGAPLDVNVTAAGHAHIDVAWLWTLDQTRQKAARTFHNMLRLMEQYPRFIFVQSQPQLYDFVRRDFPALFENIRERVAEGRWEPIGGMWVEADCNLSGPESLVRQFLLGREFARNHFGEQAESPVLWLPDVFGYAWNLPQLIKSAGLEYFFTIKIGWNQYNRLPYDSFWWQGLDGTRVLTHFSTTKDPHSPHAATYNAAATPGQVFGTWLNFQQKDYGAPGQIPPLLMSFGYGDGGGGPTAEMIENIGIMANFPGLPKVQPGKVIDFFRDLETEASQSLPVWDGELYLENHRGTYTTQAHIKRANRKSEFLLHDTEFLASYASVLDAEYRYPHAALRRAWELVCLNQFHDIIPGSSIRAVYSESLKQYDEVRQICETERDEALRAIQASVGGDLLLINPSGFWSENLAIWPGGQRHDKAPLRFGEPALTQTIENGLLIDAGEIPPYSITPFTLGVVKAQREPLPLAVTEQNLENNFLRVQFNEDGDIIRIYDKVHQRDVLPENGVANQFQAFEDRPLNWDAWDIDIFYDDKMWLAEPADSIQVVEQGPLRAALEIRRRILNSEFIQRVSLTHKSPRLDFYTSFQWRERRVLLKVAFPIDVHASQATYEIQWGNVQRPTHRNTSWDWARFETAAQKWVDLSEGGYGASLLNDCKYGHDIHQNVMRLTLLRGTTAPDPEADLGEHSFTYSLFPHNGSWDSSTIQAAYALNDPLLIVNSSGRPAGEPLDSLVVSDSANLVIETVKQAEDGSGLIVRLYESQRMRGRGHLGCGFQLSAAWWTNLLEENEEKLSIRNNRVILDYKPYQVITLRLIPNSIANG